MYMDTEYGIGFLVAALVTRKQRLSAAPEALAPLRLERRSVDRDTGTTARPTLRPLPAQRQTVDA